MLSPLCERKGAYIVRAMQKQPKILYVTENENYKIMCALLFYERLL